MKRRRTRVAVVLGWGLSAAVWLAGCGGDDFENEPRPPVPVQLTGVITEERITVSPSKLGAGPILLTIANETGQSHTVTLEGRGVRERTATINPGDTATLQKTLPRGEYVVRAGSAQAVEREIRADRLVIGPPRKSASDELLLP